MPMLPGVSFNPAEALSDRRGSASPRVQEAIRFLSLRLPRVVGGQVGGQGAIAPPRLLQALGGSGTGLTDAAFLRSARPAPSVGGLGATAPLTPSPVGGGAPGASDPLQQVIAQLAGMLSASQGSPGATAPGVSPSPAPSASPGLGFGPANAPPAPMPTPRVIPVRGPSPPDVMKARMGPAPTPASPTPVPPALSPQPSAKIKAEPALPMSPVPPALTPSPFDQPRVDPVDNNTDMMPLAPPTMTPWTAPGPVWGEVAPGTYQPGPMTPLKMKAPLPPGLELFAALFGG